MIKAAHCEISISKSLEDQNLKASAPRVVKLASISFNCILCNGSMYIGLPIHIIGTRCWPRKQPRNACPQVLHGTLPRTATKVNNFVN